MKTKTYWQVYWHGTKGYRWNGLSACLSRDEALRKAATCYAPGERWLLVPVELPDSEGEGDEGGLEFRPASRDFWCDTFEAAYSKTAFGDRRVIARRKPTPVPESRPTWEDITAEVRAMAEGAS